MINLSPHFTLAEMLRSDMAMRHGIDNANPPMDVQVNLESLCLNVLEPLRTALDNRPIIITSGYRCLELNRLLKSPDSSQHIKGQAADFHVPGLSLVSVAKVVVKSLTVQYDQLIHEGTWLHISWSKRDRRQLLTAGFSLKPPRHGYISGIAGVE